VNSFSQEAVSYELDVRPLLSAKCFECIIRVIDLLKIPNLEEVYLYRTKGTRQVTDALQKNKPGMKIYLQEGPYF
jgi:hypothetical protein